MRQYSQNAVFAMPKEPKICILHDFFLYRGGAERFDVMAAVASGADLASAYFDPGSYDLAQMGFVGKKIAFSRRLFPESGECASKTEFILAHVLSDKFKRIGRYLHFKRALKRDTGFLSEYDTVVFSGDTLSAVRNCRNDARKICYFHSIPRYLFDQKDLYLSKVPFFLRPLYVIARLFETRAFFRDLSKMDAVYVNGKNLQSYCKAHLKRDAKIIYPPVDTHEFAPCDPSEKGEYYLSFSKLATFKRVNLVVQAFRTMPEKKLLVIYGANDPQKDEVLGLAVGIPNVECRILSDNSELPGIVARAIATVFVPKNEDFGMVAIESMAAGTPVIGADSGGIKETVVPGATGLLVRENFTTAELQDAVRAMTPQRALNMRGTCVARGLVFGKGRFEKEIRAAFYQR